MSFGFGYLESVWPTIFHHSIFITHHSSLITHHSSLITQFFTPVWHHHPISITQYFSHYLWAIHISRCNFFFFFFFFSLDRSSVLVFFFLFLVCSGFLFFFSTLVCSRFLSVFFFFSLGSMSLGLKKKKKPAMSDKYGTHK